MGFVLAIMNLETQRAMRLFLFWIVGGFIQAEVSLIMCDDGLILWMAVIAGVTFNC